MMRLFSKIDVNVHNVDLRISDPDKKERGNGRVETRRENQGSKGKRHKAKRET